MTNRMFEPALDLTLKKEGRYSLDKDDPGGETFRGISRRYNPDWNGWEKIDEIKITRLYHIDSDRMDLELQTDVRSFYREQYWNKLSCGGLPQGLDIMLFDMAVNLGVSATAKILQGACGAVQDGIVGNDTLSCVKSLPVELLLDKCLKGRLYHYMTKPNEVSREKYGMGWINRSLEVHQLALQTI